MSFFLPRDLGRISELTRITQEELVQQHTLLPFATAFMPPAQANALFVKMLTSRPVDGTVLASLVQSVTQGSRHFKFCPDCVREDVAAQGESYWRRSHLVPGAYICLTHFTLLLEVTSFRIGHNLAAFKSGQPAAFVGSVVRDLPAYNPLVELARTSVATLGTNWVHRDDWANIYRERAFEKGYEMAGAQVASNQLAADFSTVFRDIFLQKLGCPIGSSYTVAWPALMVRPLTLIPFSPLRHILMTTFLTACNVRTNKPNYANPGKKPLDSAQFDDIYAAHVRATWESAARKRVRLTIQGLFTEAGMWSKFRHNRAGFPKTVMVLKEFRRSEQAERQLGRRAFWRKRLGLDKKTGKASPANNQPSKP